MPQMLTHAQATEQGYTIDASAPGRPIGYMIVRSDGLVTPVYIYTELEEGLQAEIDDILAEFETLQRQLMNDTRNMQPFERRDIAQRIEGIIRRHRV